MIINEYPHTLNVPDRDVAVDILAEEFGELLFMCCVSGIIELQYYLGNDRWAVHNHSLFFKTEEDLLLAKMKL